jgi:hypothetical protein
VLGHVSNVCTFLSDSQFGCAENPPGAAKVLPMTPLKPQDVPPMIVILDHDERWMSGC